MVLQALKCGDDICDILDSPIPSATQIVKDSERICVALHKDCVAHQPQQRPGVPSNVLSLMSNISQELEDTFNHSESDVGPALHAARQVAYWSSVFVSLVSSNANSTSTQATSATQSSNIITNASSPASLPSQTSISVTSTRHQASLPIPSPVLIANRSTQAALPTPSFIIQPSLATGRSSSISSAIDQPTLSTHLTASIQPTSNHLIAPPIPSPSIHSDINQPSVATSTISSISSAIDHPLSTHLATSIQPTSNHLTAPPFHSTIIPSDINQPSIVTSTKSSISSAVDQPTLSTHTAACIQSTSIQPTSSNPTTTIIPLSVVHHTSSTPTAAFVSARDNTRPVSKSTTDPATSMIFREYGSGSFIDWLDSLSIPRNIEKLQQVKDLWEVGTINCPPLHKWTVTMRNHRSKSGKNSSLFSQRKYIYNLFKNCNFDENLVFTRYNELRPGKLYKMLHTKNK